MNLLLVATGDLPYTFSENICNGKLVLALQLAGHHVDVICRKDEGPAYCTAWTEPWSELEKQTHEVTYNAMGKVGQVSDILKACFCTQSLPMSGIRWCRYAVDLAIKLHFSKHYDAILTRSPSDAPHLVGRAFARRTGIKWLANWNDPAMTIWPGCYDNHISPLYSKMYNYILTSCMKEATVNTFPSKLLMEHFQKHFPDLKAKNCRVIPHVQLPDACFPRHRYRKGAIFRMCHAGNMSGERNPSLFFAAMRRVMDESGQELELDIMGVSSPHVQELVDTYNLSNHVRFIGVLSYRDALITMQTYDILVLLEAQLDLGIFFASKITDYAQTGRPILAVSPKQGFATDLFNQYGGGISVCNDQEDSIVEGLCRLLVAWQSDTLESDFSLSQLNKQFCAENINNIYEELLSL